ALHRTAGEHAYDFRLLEAVLTVNDRQKTALVPRIVEALGDADGRLDGRRVAVWGLAFKPNTDDVREAPAHYVIRALAARGADVVAFDPEAIETTRALLGEGDLDEGSIAYAAGLYDAAVGADALVICTEWPEFRRPDLERVRRALKTPASGFPLVFDGRNVFEPERMAEAGFDYHAIGRPHVAPQAVEDEQRAEA
ncbi:MAG: UDP binding domain-containing protein, partial [Rubricoccaceae bacterium]|nr:UDP binding domain-containing protein [Rubricoccaceae bacterium]